MIKNTYRYFIYLNYLFHTHFEDKWQAPKLTGSRHEFICTVQNQVLPRINNHTLCKHFTSLELLWRRTDHLSESISTDQLPVTTINIVKPKT